MRPNPNRRRKWKAITSIRPPARTSSTKPANEPGGLALAPAQNRTVPAEQRDPNDPSTWGKVGRNELCPCGSGKKYKHCHGAFK